MHENGCLMVSSIHDVSSGKVMAKLCRNCSLEFVGRTEHTKFLAQERTTLRSEAPVTRG